MGHPAISVLVCLAAAYALSIASYPLIVRQPAFAIHFAAIVALAIFLCPLLIPGQYIIPRALSAVFCTDALFRVLDFARQIHGGSVAATWSEYCRFLVPFPIFLVVFGQKDRRFDPARPLAPEALSVILGAAGFAAMLALVLAALKIEAFQTSFALDHIVKVVLFMVAIESLSQMLLGLERLAGFGPRPIIDRAFVARTPAEFWSRYNNRVHTWFYWNIFAPIGGRRHPIRGIWAVCLVSAVHHELAFTIATSRFTGYQAAFFLLQAPAIMLSPQLERLSNTLGAGGEILARTLTAVWLGITSILFFHGVDRVFPFVYASEPWLP
jgi:hypothetical protein